MEATVRSLVVLATDASQQSPAHGTLSQMKRLVRTCDALLRVAFEALQDRLQAPNSRVRLLAVQICDELFQRSKAFRGMVAPFFQQFLELSTGHVRDNPLPGPTNEADELRTHALAVVEKWNNSFGNSYRQIRLGYCFLKDVVKLQFPSMGEEQTQPEQRMRSAVLRKYEDLLAKHEEVFEECRISCSQLAECLDLLEEGRAPAAVSNKVQSGSESDGDFEWEDCTDHAGWRSQPEMHPDATRVESSGTEEEQMGLSIYAVDDNPEEVMTSTTPMDYEWDDDDPILEHLRGLYKSATQRLLPTLQGWLSTLVRVDAGEPASSQNLQRQAVLRTAISLRNALTSNITRVSALNIPKDILLSSSKAQQNDLGQDRSASTSNGRSGLLGKRSAHHRQHRYKGGPKHAKSKRRRKPPLDPTLPKEGPYIIKNFVDAEWLDAHLPEGNEKEDHVENLAGSSGSIAATPSCTTAPNCTPGAVKDSQASRSRLSAQLRAKLLDRAPVVDDPNSVWGKESMPRPMLRTGLDIQNHWGPVDDTAMVAPERVQELTRYQASYYKPRMASQGMAASNPVATPNVDECPGSPPAAAVTPATITSHDVQNRTSSSDISKRPAPNGASTSEGLLPLAPTNSSSASRRGRGCQNRRAVRAEERAYTQALLAACAANEFPELAEQEAPVRGSSRRQRKQVTKANKLRSMLLKK